MRYGEVLGTISVDEFLRHSWQKKPLLIRQAMANFKSPLTADELAGLACEAEVEARLVIGQPKTRQWTLRHGPFTEHDFSTLPKSHWSLLVQRVDHLLHEVARLRERFRFIPDWRIDDIMISYSSDQGSVGPHVDNYDVFLLQGSGRKRWQIMHQPVEDEILQPGSQLRVLEHFQADEEWMLEPGDMLYLPPRIAHWGTAEGDGMTYSLGFRSPSLAELLASYCDQRLGQWDEKDRYLDPDLRPQDHPAEITPQVISKISQWLRSLPIDEQEVAHWFGRLVTAGLHGDEPYALPSEVAMSSKRLLALLREDRTLIRSEEARLAFAATDAGLCLFVNGHEYVLPPQAKDFVGLITGAYEIPGKKLLPYSNEYASLLLDFLKNGIFYFHE